MTTTEQALTRARAVLRRVSPDAAVPVLRLAADVGAALCDCPPCPGRGNDGHGLSHCAECCFGSGVEADIDCLVHGVVA